MKIVLIHWRDAADHKDAWVDVEDAEKFGDADCEIVSVGYLIRKTDRYYTIGGDWDEVDKDYGRVTKIPVNTIISVKEIQP